MSSTWGDGRLGGLALGTAIENLQQAVKSAAVAGPFVLDAAFLIQGLDDASVTVPAAYDSDIAAAFQVAATSFEVSVSPDEVGDVSDDGFTVTGAVIPFPGSTGIPIQATATLVFVVTEGADSSLVVQIASSPANWTWSDSFEFMGGWPFSALTPEDALFVFSTVDGTYPFGNGGTDSGMTVAGGAKQNFSSALPMPEVAEPYLPLFIGLKAPAAMTLEGVLDMSLYNGETVLLPIGTLTATLQDVQLSVFYLQVSNPSIELQIPPPADDIDDSDENDESEDTGDSNDSADGDYIGQAPTLTISAGLAVGATPPEESPYALQVQVLPPAPSDETTEYSIAITATGNGAPLTPDAIVSLVGGIGSYFEGVPAVLQQFLAFVSLEGLTLTGSLDPLAVAQTGVLIGSTEGTSWSPLPYAPPQLNFTITWFELQWWMMDPFGTNRQQNFIFQTQFTLLPSVFKSSDGESDGIFSASFDSELTFTASFDGTAMLSDFLSVVSGGIVSLPSWIEAGLSDISLSVENASNNFSFGSTFGVEVSFLTVDSYPILQISSATVSVSASTPPQEGGSDASGESVWQGSIEGLVGVGPFQAYVTVSWHGTESLWKLNATLAEPLDIGKLIQQFFYKGGDYDFPSFLAPELTIESFAISAELPSGDDRDENAQESAAVSSYAIDVSFLWALSLGGIEIVDLNTAIGLTYANDNFTATVEGEWTYPAINLDLVLTYSFDEKNNNQTLSLEWEGFTATYKSGDQSVTFTLQGWSVGSLLQAMMRTLGKPYFTLASPWDLLNQISLDGFSLTLSLDENAENPLSGSYTLSSPLNLGFIQIEGLTFRLENKDGSRRVVLSIECPPPPIDLGPLTTEEGEDVENMPDVPGRGSAYFKVFLFALGQRIGITGHDSFANTAAVIAALSNVPSTTGATNPVNPSAVGQPDGQPYYNQSNNWLIAGHLGLLETAPDVWTIDAMVVFDDPDLYGLRLALAGQKAGGLAGLAIDILYKKISDDLGLFQIDFTFPDAVRNINMGAMSIVLPQIGIEVYTNGDFLIDLGFPYDMDFTRSCALYAIVLGVPVMGAGGLYFGSLSSATSTLVPQTTGGTFDPVIALGVGLELGLGYNIVEGPLTAGFALTVFAIVEGVLAAWHPYSGQTSGNSLQDQYYFKLSGTMGILGMLYGKVDFGIVQASVNVSIVISLQITYESFRALQGTASARVNASARVRINLGLFKITLKFSFSTTVKVTFQIGETTKAPWDANALTESLNAQARLLTRGSRAVKQQAAALRPRMKTVSRAMEEATPVLKLLLSPQYTIYAPEAANEYSQQQGAFVFLTVIDAPTATDEPGKGGTSFDQLCATFFPWVIDALGQPEGETVDLAAALETTVTRDQLDAYIERLADTSNPPLNMTGLLQFLASAFVLNLETPEYAQTSGDQALFEAGTSVFPVFDGLSLLVPDPGGAGGSKPVTFETYATAKATYRDFVSAMFEAVEATIESQEEDSAPQARATDDAPESMAALIFVEYFCMMGRQLLQAARNLLESFAWQLGPQDSINSIVATVNGNGNAIGISDVATPNQYYPLTPGVSTNLPALSYTVQSGKTLQDIANQYSDSASPQRWATTPAELIADPSNAVAHILQPGVPIPGTQYRTVGGDTFESVAKALSMTVEQLSRDPAMYEIPDLLTPAAPMTIPAMSYTTASGDTLADVATFFSTTVTEFATASSSVQWLFSMTDEDGLLKLANLWQWTVAGLWDGVQATDQVSQTAGMISRLLMFGLRLPNADGLTLSSEFLFPQQTDYGLYQLIGQEFPVAAGQTDSVGVEISVAEESHGVNLSFVEFNGEPGGKPGNSASVDLTQAYADLGTVLTWAQTGKFQPSPSFEVTPPSLVQAKAFATNNFSNWSTSNVKGLEDLMASGGATEDSVGAQSQPSLWPLPPSLLSLIEARQQVLSTVFADPLQAIPLMPQFLPQRGQTSPASQSTTYSNLVSWAWTARVDFQIRQLPLTGLSSGGASETPSGTASAPALTNVYEVVGASSADIQTLAELLSAINFAGPGLVSGLFLLYPQAGESGVLATLDTPEFLAFLTQANLSTETNPNSLALRSTSAEALSIPRGIGNSPQEFIRLLWELSTVRSGGYYLFYQAMDGGGGFPTGVFDTNGMATLTTVATLDVNLLGATPLAFVNSFVTTDSIDTTSDVVQLLSQEASGASAPTTGAASETLRSLSELYGAGPGAIAESNADLALQATCVVPVKGIVRQLSVEDTANPNETLTELAKYYSNGAQNTLTPDEIQRYNPGVQVEMAAVFYIPTVYYEIPFSVNVDSPGNTFGSMANYYGMSIPAMAINALDLEGLFPANSELTIDTEVFDLRSTLGPGNVSFAMTLANPGEPSDNPSDSEYPEQYLYSLYNILSAGLRKNQFFALDSPMGLPFGPQTDDSDVAQEQPATLSTAHSTHAQDLQRRRAMLTASADEDYQYSQSLGFASYATVNAAPSNPAQGLPPASDSPYIGVGSTCQVSLRWQDVYGNTTITPFQDPPPDYTGALNGEAITILYNDRLTQIGAWPKTIANYTYSGEVGAPVLNLNFALDATAYANNPDQIAGDLEVYQSIYFQLNQDYTNAGVPGVEGNAVAMSLRNSILTTAETSLTDEQAAAVRGYVSACVQYLAAHTTASEAPKASIAFATDLTTIADGNILAMNVSLVFMRNAVLTDAGVAALANGLSVANAILPQADPGGQNPAYVVFAQAMEQAFQTNDWYLKVGEGMKAATDSQSDSTTMQLWAVRFGKASGTGIYFEIGKDVSYYAAKPVATTLASATVTIEDYTSGNPVTMSFNGVDQNQWFQTCLSAIDTFLSATDSTSAFILDKLLGIDDPLENGSLGKILEAKQSLADSIAGMALPILSTSLDDASTQWSAGEKLRQQLLNQIGAAYSAGASIVYPLSAVSGAPADNPAGPPSLYGQPHGVLQGSDADGNQDFTLTAARIPLGPTTDGGDTYDPRLTFFFNTRNVESQAYVPLQMTLDITHLEFNRTYVPGIDGYVQSHWLVFVNGPFEYTLTGDGVANIPVVDRNLPTPPSMQNQSAATTDNDPSSPRDLTLWTYSFEYLYRFASQDTVHNTIQINSPSATNLAAASDSGSLFQALAQFVTAYPAISADFALYLDQINAKTTDPAIVNGAAKAVGKFEQYLTAVADTYAQSVAPRMTGAPLPQLIEVKFESVLVSDEATQAARTDLIEVTIDGIAATFDAKNMTITNGTVALPVPVVAIDPDQYTPVVAPGAQDPAYLYQLKNSNPPVYLTLDQAVTNTQRTVWMSGLDVLLHQNCRASVSVDRNEILFPIEDMDAGVSTNPEFIFTTPEVSFADPVVPRLTHPEFAFARAGTDGASLEQALNDFFAQLFKGGDGSVTVEASMTGTYSYEMNSGFEITLPVCLLPPVETQVSPAVTPSFTGVVVNAMDEWVASEHPAKTAARINFKLTMFGSNEKQPLLVIDDLYQEVASGGIASKAEPIY